MIADTPDNIRHPMPTRDLVKRNLRRFQLQSEYQKPVFKQIFNPSHRKWGKNCFQTLMSLRSQLGSLWANHVITLPRFK